MIFYKKNIINIIIISITLCYIIYTLYINNFNLEKEYIIYNDIIPPDAFVEFEEFFLLLFDKDPTLIKTFQNIQVEQCNFLIETSFEKIKIFLNCIYINPFTYTFGITLDLDIFRDYFDKQQTDREKVKKQVIYIIIDNLIQEKVKKAFVEVVLLSCENNLSHIDKNTYTFCLYILETYYKQDS